MDWKLVVILLVYGAFVNSQVIFEDEEVPPRRQQFGNNVLVISLERPSQSSSGFRRPPQTQGQNGFGFGNQNQNQNGGGGFRNPSSSFGSSSASSSSSSAGFQQQRPNNNFQGYQNGGFFQSNNQNNNFQQQQQQQQQSGFQNHNQNQNEIVIEIRRPDCRTYFDTDGFCTSLAACGRIARDIQNRSPTVVARILGRSICGFSGVIPKVCCPTGRGGQQNPQPVTQPPFPNKPNDFGSGGVGQTGNNFNNQNNNGNRKPGFGNGNNSGGSGVGQQNGNNFNNQNNNGNTKPGFGNGNNGDGGGFGQNVNNFDQNNGNKKPAFNGGGGLVVIPAPSETSTTTSTTQFPIQVITTKKPKPAGNPGGGLIIGDGPIALVPPSQSGGGDSLGFSANGLPEDCGFSNASRSRIVGGKTSEKGAWPWIAALGYKDQAGNVNYLCGGALISPEYVVTASHCLHGRNDLSSVRLGDHDIYSTADGVTPLEVEVDKTILHPKYDPATFKNDIALLHLKRPVPYSRQIHPICLPSTPQLRNQRFENTSPFVAGWGAIQFNGPSSSVLREVQIPTVPDSVCQEKYSTFKTAVVDDTNICAGLQTGGKDACQGIVLGYIEKFDIIWWWWFAGDSGGPLQQPVGTNKYVLIGVVSFGFKCAEPDFPGVYTRVTSHLDWLQNTMKQ